MIGHPHQNYESGSEGRLKIEQNHWSEQPQVLQRLQVFRIQVNSKSGQ